MRWVNTIAVLKYGWWCQTTARQVFPSHSPSSSPSYLAKSLPLSRFIPISSSDVEILEPPLRSMTNFSWFIYADSETFQKIQEPGHLGGKRRVRYPSTENWIIASIKKDQKIICFVTRSPAVFLNMAGLWSFIDLFGAIHCVCIDLEHSKRPTAVTELVFCKSQGFFPLHKL